MKKGLTERPLPASGLATSGDAISCPLPQPPDLSGISVMVLHPQPPLADYLAAMPLARSAAQAQLGESMLLSWYDRDRNFEAP